MKRFLTLLAGVILWFSLQGQVDFTMQYSYWFDHDYTTRQSGNIGNGRLLLDVSQLSDGLHSISIQLGNGNTAQLQHFIFIKPFPVLSDSLPDSMQYSYWFDHDYTTRQSGNIGNGRLQLDVSQLSDGLHSISIQLGNGNTAQLQHFIFIKPFPVLSDSLPDSLRKIEKYEYFLNGNIQQRYTAAVVPCDTLQLITVLPMDNLPIRPTCFHFNPNGGHPVIYAKNDITFRFWTGDKRFVDKTSYYVDEHVSDTVIADTLERNTTRTIASPTDNNIHWFKLAAEVGDSLSFRANRPCTFQLFAPSGTEVFSIKGDGVLNWDGCHARENGVYYLAVHDAENNGDVTVSYQWIYKYALMEHTPTLTGNGNSMVMVNLYGNGFDKLVNVSFHNADTIWMMDTMLVFDINNAIIEFHTDNNLPLGAYNMLLEFRDSTGNIDTLAISPGIRVVPAEYGEVAVDYDFISSFVEPHIITMSVTNTGNVPYLAVPIIIAHTSPEEASITFNNNNFLLDTTEVVDSLFYQATNLFGQGVTAKYIPLMIGHIGPYETQTMKIAFDCPKGSGFDFYAWSGRPWNTLNDTNYNSAFANEPQYNGDNSDRSPSTFIRPLAAGDDEPPQQTRRAQRSRSTCEMPDPCSEAGRMPEIGSLLECLCGVGVADIKTIANGFLSIEAKHNRDMNEWFSEQIPLGSEGELPYGEIRIQTPSSLLREAVDHCWDGGGIGKEAIMRLWDHLDGEDCPDPPIPIHPEVPAPPVDPNEIIGYSAASGSLAVSATQMVLPYTIEFENDSLLASGMAHTVVVTDTLDGDYFDLNSFSATSFTIGDEVVAVDGGNGFARTVDMRPEINVVAQVQLDYRIDTNYAVAIWNFSSLDPMTLMPTVADTLGFLAIGGTGEVQFAINRKTELADSTVIANRAFIKFDNEEPIATSTWVNIIDNTPPVSTIDSITYANGSATISISATDNLSGAWRYNVYGQLDSSIWLPLAVNVPADTVAAMNAYEGQYRAFLTLAVDSAGNVERAVRYEDTARFNVSVLCDSTHGYITGAGRFPMHDSVTVEAFANQCYHFTQWCDGVTDNPRILILTRDTSLTALYVRDSATTGSDTATACDNYTWHESTFTISTIDTFHTTNAAGCDSTVTLHLTINHSNTGDTATVRCDSFSWHGNSYSATPLVAPTHIYTNAAGCDSTVTLHLTVNHSNTGDTVATACDRFVWHGSTCTTDTTLSRMLTNAAGCDSVVTLHLTVNHSAAINIADSCDGSYSWHDSIYTVSGTYLWVGSTADGCDSTVTLHLVVGNVGIPSAPDADGLSIPVYPNPTTGWITIGASDVERVEVYDQGGRLVISATESHLDFSDLPSGVYTLRISFGRGQSVQRVIKK